MARFTSNPVQTNSDTEHREDIIQWQWALCNLVSMKSSLLPESSSLSLSAQELMDQLAAKEPAALCITLRDALYSHLSRRIRPLPSADINSQVNRLLDEVQTHMGKPFVKISLEDEPEQHLETIDLVCWIIKVGEFHINWERLDPEYFPLYLAILFGIILSRVGKVIDQDTSITKAIPAVVDQFTRGEGVLPDPFKVTPLPPLRSDMFSSRPGLGMPQHIQLLPTSFASWAVIIASLLSVQVILLWTVRAAVYSTQSKWW
ncbi:hypothetical protein QQX98_007107 [Neonectria punicea]|uniref:Uncharacterized protein n=1 Tax=Neonectria punicea TaxID=979145 RepID=A0ABR1GYU4_9HYPO